jgi:hypothetical protein
MKKGRIARYSVLPIIIIIIQHGPTLKVAASARPLPLIGSG